MSDPSVEASHADPSGERVVLGKISGVFGVQGWLKVYSYTSPRDNIVGYSPWLLCRDGGETTHAVLAGRAQGDGVVARLAGITDRDAAALLVGAEIVVERATLGPPAEKAAPGEYFWVDLQGMEVRGIDGRRFGVVDHLFETGANDVMVVVGETRHLIPFVYRSVVLEVDGGQRRITVDWMPDF